MNSKLKALLVAVGLAVSGGVAYQVFTVPPAVTPGQLADAGIAECSDIVVRASVRTGQTDAGAAGRYQSWLVPAKLCPGSDLILTGLPAGFEVFRTELVTDAGTVQLGLRPDPGQCACRRQTAGTCRLKLPDGGLVIPPLDTELQPGQWQGNCQRKSCGVIAGDQGLDMPEVCK